jgi:hypothetical protein
LAHVPIGKPVPTFPEHAPAPATIAVGWPGRIGGYRNSTPRRVKLIGIGEGAKAVVARVAQARLPNVLVAPQSEDAITAALDAPVKGASPNMIVLVYRSGDRVALPRLADRPKLLVTLVRLEDAGTSTHALAHDANADTLRALADLFITTTDAEFVLELISNLTS